MAKIRKIYDQTIKPDGNKLTIYPITSTRAVYTPESITMEALINEGYRFGGVIEHLEDSPEFTDQRVFYLADKVGVYPNFGNLTLAGGELGVFCYNKSQWIKGILKGGGTNLTGYQVVTSASLLPDEESTIGYIIGTDLYVWVGEGGDTKEGKYKNVGPFVGPQGNGIESVAIDPPDYKLVIQFTDGTSWESEDPVINLPNEDDLIIDSNKELKFNDRPTTYGMGYCILRRNKTFAEQVTETNTIYEIRYDFDLDDESVTIPENCELRFNGGSLNNGTCVFDISTGISGNPKIYCDIDGVLSKADITWFGAKADYEDGDIAPYIEKAEAISNHIIIPEGAFYIKTAAVIGPRAVSRVVDWYGDVFYNGTASEIEVVTINFGGAGGTLNMYGSLRGTGVSQLTADRFKVKGLVFKNCKRGIFHIGIISGFNVGVMLIGKGAGCASNTFYLNHILECNEGLLITQDNDGDNIGWANENLFIGGSIGVYSSWNYATKACNHIYIGSITETDEYKKANNLVFIKQNLETARALGTAGLVPIYAENIADCSFYQTRFEGADVPMKLVGTCGRLIVEPGYQAYGTYDLSELTTTTSATPLFKGLDYICTPINIDSCPGVIGDGGANYYSDSVLFGAAINSSTVALNDNGAPVSILENGDLNKFGIKVSFDVAGYNYVMLNQQNKSGERRTVYVKGVETFDGTEVDQEHVIVHANSLSYYPARGYWATGADVSANSIVFNKNIKTVIIAFANVYSVEFRAHRGYKLASQHLIKSGTTSERPTYKYAGYQFFDTTVNKPTVWDGTAWVEEETIPATSKVLILNSQQSFAEQITYSWVIYEIRNNFDLSNETIAIPNGCTLRFNGGSISNGKLTGNFKIEAADIKVFHNIDLSEYTTNGQYFNIAWSVGTIRTLTQDIVSKLPSWVDYHNYSFSASELLSFNDVPDVHIRNLSLLSAYSVTRNLSSVASGTCRSLDTDRSTFNTAIVTDQALSQDYVGYLIYVKTCDAVEFDERPDESGVPTIYKGVTSIITKISGTTVYIADYIDRFGVSRTYDVTTVNSTYTVYPPLKFSMENCYFKSRDTTAGISVTGYDINIKDSTFEAESGARCLLSLHGHTGLVENCEVKNTYFSGTDTSYGIQVNNGTNIRINNCTFREDRRAVDFSGSFQTRYCEVSNCSVYSRENPGTGSALGGHSSSYGNTWRNNKIYGKYQVGIQCRGEHERIIDNEFYAVCTGSLISIAVGAEIIGNRVNNIDFSSLSNTGITLSSDATADVIVRDNYFIVRSRFLYGDVSNKTLVIEDNHVDYVTSGASVQPYIIESPYMPVRAVVEGNHFSNIRGASSKLPLIFSNTSNLGLAGLILSGIEIPLKFCDYSDNDLSAAELAKLTITKASLYCDMKPHSVYIDTNGDFCGTIKLYLKFSVSSDLATKVKIMSENGNKIVPGRYTKEVGVSQAINYGSSNLTIAQSYSAIYVGGEGGYGTIIPAGDYVVECYL